MDDVVQTISDQLVAINKQSGVDEHGYRKVMIPQPQDRKNALEHLKKKGYQKYQSFNFTNFDVVGEVRKLHGAGRSVWVMIDLSNLKFDLYVSNNSGPKKRSTTTTTVSNTGGFKRLAEAEHKLKGRETKKKNEGCFIATACFDSYDAPEVIILRSFRDNFLLTNRIGKDFIAFYYLFSPSFSIFFLRHYYLKFFVRTFFLKPIISIVHQINDPNNSTVKQ